MSNVIRIHAPRPGTPVGILWPKAAIAGKPVVADGRPTQVADWGGAYWAVRFRASDGEVLEFVPGTPVRGGAAAVSDDLANLIAPFRASLTEAWTGADLYFTRTPTIRVLESGPLYLSGVIETSRVVLFAEWYPDLAAGVVRIVLRNGVVDPAGAVRIRDLVGTFRLAHGALGLYAESNVRHHFGRMVSYRFAVTMGEAGPAVSLQTEPWPMAAVSLPLELFAELGLLPGYHESVGVFYAEADDDWDNSHGGSIIWPQGGSSGGGKPTLAPLPRHDVLALHDPVRHLPAALWAADRFPYPYFFTTVAGAWIRPQTHPSGWCDVVKTGYHDGRTFQDFGPATVINEQELEANPYRADCSHLPQAFLVPALLTADPFYRFAAEGLAFGAAMQSRGLAGGWLTPHGAPMSPVSSGVRNSRGPDGRGGWVGRQERAWGWAINQRLDAALVGGHRDLVGLLRSAFAIARGHYLDSVPHPDDLDRHWGFHCAPWWHEAVHQDGHGRPPVPMLSDGHEAYARPQNAIRPDRCTDARASWQDAFIARPIVRAAKLYGRVPGLDWLQDLADYAVAGHLRMLRSIAPETAYCWPTRNAEGWITAPEAIMEAFFQAFDGDIPADGRPLHLDVSGLETHNGYAYVAYNTPALAGIPEWQEKIEPVMELLPIEWRLTR